MQYPWHLYAMGGLYFIAGIMHFVKPRMYQRIMPNYMPKHKLLVFLSGVAEIILGVSICIPATKDLAVYGIITMLLIFLPVHFHMLFGKNAAMGLPKWALILRIPLQFVLIFWAYTYL